MKGTLIAKFMGPIWSLPGADRTQVGHVWATLTLLSGYRCDVSMEMFHLTGVTQLPWEKLCRKSNFDLGILSRHLHGRRTLQSTSNRHRPDTRIYYFPVHSVSRSAPIPSPTRMEVGEEWSRQQSRYCLEEGYCLWVRRHGETHLEIKVV